MAHRDPTDLLPLSPLSFHLLVTLAHGPRHGYGMMKEISARTAGALQPATGTVYLALQRLEDDGLIEEAPRRKGSQDDSRRRNYRLTRFGRSVAAAETRRMLSYVHAATDARLIPVSQLLPATSGGNG